jgi:hypothetical protein
VVLVRFRTPVHGKDGISDEFIDGAVVSIVQETIAAAPRLPATSRRRTANVCEPSASEAVVVGEVQVDHEPLSTRHW